MADLPATMIEPGPPVGRAFRLEPVEILDRTLQADRRRMQAPHGREAALRTGERDDSDRPGPFVDHRHVDGLGLAPEIEHRPGPPGELLAQPAPQVFADLDARPGTMAVDPVALP